MNHFPVFVGTAGQRVVLAGGGDAAEAKLRLLMKTEAKIAVFAAAPSPHITRWAAEGRLTLTRRRLQPGDARGARLAYGAHDDARADARAAGIARADGALVNIVDNLADSDFITPAIVDRSPLTVAIGTEGAAPVLARAIKSDLEERLAPSLGLLARIGKAFRPRAEALPMGRKRRRFWADYYFTAGPQALDASGPQGVETALQSLLDTHLSAAAAPGAITVAGTGPGDPELLTLKARKALDTADLVIHEAATPPAILDLARREAHIHSEGADSLARALQAGRAGAQAIWLRSDAAPPGLEAAARHAGVAFHIIPGVPAQPAAQQTWSPAA